MSNIDWGAPLTDAQMKLLRAAGLPDDCEAKLFGRASEDLYSTVGRLAYYLDMVTEKFSVPANHSAYKLLEAGWLDGRNVALWFGGEEAPEDLDFNEPVLFRDGDEATDAVDLGWTHSNHPWDIIAYIRKGNVDKSPDGEHQEPEVSKSNPKIDAIAFLDKAEGLLKHRGIDYDSPEGERSMGKTVAMFNAMTGRDLSAVDGWMFMMCLKMVRQATSAGFHQDSAEDLIAYAALAAEEGARGV